MRPQHLRRLASLAVPGVLAAVLTAAAVCLPSASVAEDLLLGQSCDLTGPSRELGRGLRAGVLARIAMANASGGAGGRTLRLLTRDDHSRPFQAIKNVRELLTREHVAAFIGHQGTRSALASVGLVLTAERPFLFPVTQAGMPASPGRPLVLLLRPGLDAQMKTVVEHFVDKVGLTRIAYFGPQDDQGRQVRDWLSRELMKRGLAVTAESSYERGTMAVGAGVLELAGERPQLVVVNAETGPAARFVDMALQAGMRASGLCLAPTQDPDILVRKLGKQGIGVHMTRDIPPPEPGSRLARDYARAMDRFAPSMARTQATLEGYLAASVVCRALDAEAAALGRPVAPDNDLSWLASRIMETGSVDLGGLRLTFAPGDMRGLDRPELVRLGADGLHSPD